MADLNQCTFTGRLGRDPELKTMPGGDNVVQFSIAVGKRWKDRATGEAKEQTVWVPVVFYGAIAKSVGEYAKKGTQVMVSGEFFVRQYKDRDGNDRSVTEIRGDKFQIMGSRQDSGGGQQRPQQTQQPARAAAPASDYDSDIPF
jgi:single-strand DNA-binding protein